MPRKVYLKPPPPTKTMFIAQIVIGALFLVFAVVFFLTVQSEMGEEKPLIALFFIIFMAVCIVIIIHAVKALRLVEEGKFEIAEVSGCTGDVEGDFDQKLRNLEALKKDGLISEAEYRKKRAEIMGEKW
jgi:hypothetical protein